LRSSSKFQIDDIIQAQANGWIWKEADDQSKISDSIEPQQLVISNRLADVEAYVERPVISKYFSKSAIEFQKILNIFYKLLFCITS